MFPVRTRARTLPAGSRSPSCRVVTGLGETRNSTDSRSALFIEFNNIERADTTVQQHSPSCTNRFGLFGAWSSPKRVIPPRFVTVVVWLLNNNKPQPQDAAFRVCVVWNAEACSRRHRVQSSPSPTTTPTSTQQCLMVRSLALWRRNLTRERANGVCFFQSTAFMFVVCFWMVQLLRKLSC